MGASPDEPAHIIKAAAVAQGEWLGQRSEQSGVVEVAVPRGLASAQEWACTAHDSSQPASCLPNFVSDGKLTPTVTSAGLYNPVYYALVGWPSLLTDDPRLAVYGMRVVSAVLVSFFFAVTMTALLTFRRPFIAGIATLTVLTPTVFFLTGAVNPNALEVATGAALLSVLLLLVRGPELRSPAVAVAVVAVSGALLANTRGLSPLWMASIALIAIVGAPWPRLRALLARPAAWAALAALAAGVGFAVWWLLYSGTLGSMGSFSGAGAVTPVRAFVTMLVDRAFDPGLIGLFGWLDTPAPEITFVLWSFLSLGLVLAAAIVARGRDIAALLMALAMFFLIPPAMQAASIEASGYIWQGRYTLIAFAALAVTCAVILMQADPAVRLERRVQRKALILVVALVTAVQAYTLLFTTKRYAVGIDGWWGDFLHAAHWYPPLGPFTWVIALVLGLAAIAVVWAAWAEKPVDAEAPVDVEAPVDAEAPALLLPTR
ncbi:hypothetical protein AWU67_01980 [Microterricola viridarii]|uniref:Uncharacterized protein n=2 Tax=Microterricola viridarii TaxID=412690 RepID=A0A0Y0N1M3_9MICO|nr:hypothetical protein AWU67_01980 [Microterricola viridarii]